MRHAVFLPQFAEFGDVHVLVELARAAEAAGWDGFFLWDHLMHGHAVPFADPWITLAAIACSTERVRIGPMITPLPRRRPWQVAREAVTLDHLSRGRVVLGVGLGVDHWREFGGFSGEARDDKDRARLLDDGIEIVTRLWTGEKVTYSGAVHAIDDVQFLPRPVQTPRIPIWSAMLLPANDGPVRRGARVDGVMPIRRRGAMTADDVRSVRAAIAAVRGSESPFDVAVTGTGANAAALAEAGATWLLTDFDGRSTLAEARRVIEHGPPAS